MKKFITALVSVFAIVVLALTMAACSSKEEENSAPKVDGNTYVFESLKMGDEVVGEGDMTYDYMKNKGLKFEGGKIYYTSDGQVTSPEGNPYTQNGKTITITGTADKLTVNGDKITMETQDGDITMTVTYKKA